MNITRLHNGALEITDIINGYLVRRVYFGYSKREAIKLFKNEVQA